MTDPTLAALPPEIVARILKLANTVDSVEHALDGPEALARLFAPHVAEKIDRLQARLDKLEKLLRALVGEGGPALAKKLGNPEIENTQVPED